MKKLVASLVFFAASSAMADTTLFKCLVPAEKAPAVTLEIVKAADTSVDFVTINVTTKSNSFILFNQLDQGTVDKMLAAGEFSMMILGENFGQVDGVIKDAGLIQISKTGTDTFEGFMLAKGDIFPLFCTNK